MLSRENTFRRRIKWYTNVLSKLIYKGVLFTRPLRDQLADKPRNTLKGVPLEKHLLLMRYGNRRMLELGGRWDYQILAGSTESSTVSKPMFRNVLGQLETRPFRSRWGGASKEGPHSLG